MPQTDLERVAAEFVAICERETGDHGGSTAMVFVGSNMVTWQRLSDQAVNHGGRDTYAKIGDQVDGTPESLPVRQVMLL